MKKLLLFIASLAVSVSVLAQNGKVGTSGSLVGQITPETLAEIKSAGIDYIEVTMNNFVRKQPENEVYIKAYQALNDIREAGLKVWSVHLPYSSTWDVSIIDPKKREAAVVFFEEMIRLAGIFEPPPGFLHGLRSLCDRYGCVLILDEIQSGYGRSGKFYAHQYSGVRADIITSAKGMANGFPIGAVLISPAIKAEYGMLGTTFGGNQLACTAALAVIDVMENEHLVENAARMGDYFKAAFDGAEGLDKALKEYRGRGLMIGMEIKDEYLGLRDKLLFEKKFFTGAAGPKVIRLLPSLTVSKETADRFINAWKELTK